MKLKIFLFILAMLLIVYAISHWTANPPQIEQQTQVKNVDFNIKPLPLGVGDTIKVHGVVVGWVVDTFPELGGVVVPTGKVNTEKFYSIKNLEKNQFTW